MHNMKPLVHISIALALVCVGTSQISWANGQQAGANSNDQQPLGNQAASNKQQHPPIVAAAGDRQGRSISSASGNGGANNMIEHMGTTKARLESDRRAIQEFLTTKNVLKSIVKLLIGNADEANATSRSVLTVLSKMLDLLKNTFGQKARSGTARTLKDSAEDAANAGVSVLQGYVKSVLTQDQRCAQRYLCQASKEATRDGRDFGYVIASVGGYASSYLLDNNKSNMEFKHLLEASNKGRQTLQDDCAKYYECAEQQ